MVVSTSTRPWVWGRSAECPARTRTTLGRSGRSWPRPRCRSDPQSSRVGSPAVCHELKQRRTRRSARLVGAVPGEGWRAAQQLHHRRHRDGQLAVRGAERSDPTHTGETTTTDGCSRCHRVVTATMSAIASGHPPRGNGCHRSARRAPALPLRRQAEHRFGVVEAREGGCDVPPGAMLGGLLASDMRA